MTVYTFKLENGRYFRAAANNLEQAVNHLKMVFTESIWYELFEVHR